MASTSPTQCDSLRNEYFSGAPSRTELASAREPGTRLIISGTIFAPDGQTTISNALLDVWQANSQGRYSQGGRDFNLRGTMLTNARGFYQFRTIYPGHFSLNRRLRPAHIHIMITAPGFPELITQLYFTGDPYLFPNDPCTECKSDDPRRIIDLRCMQQGKIEWLEGTFNIILGSQCE